MAVAECTPLVKRIWEPEYFGRDKIVCTVNSFTSDEMKAYDDADGEGNRILRLCGVPYSI